MEQLITKKKYNFSAINKTAKTNALLATPKQQPNLLLLQANKPRSAPNKQFPKLQLEHTHKQSHGKGTGNGRADADRLGGPGGVCRDGARRLQPVERRHPGVPAGGSHPQPDGAAVGRVLRRAGGGRPGVPVPVQERRRRVGEVLPDRHQPRHGAAGQVRPRHASQLLRHGHRASLAHPQ